MNKAIHFETSAFDVTLEKENPINPVYGYTLLVWLADKLKKELDIDEPMAEDWGWYTFVEFEKREYMIGACALAEDDYQKEDSIEWILQIDKVRSFKEKLLGKEKMTIENNCFLFFKKIIENEQLFKNVEIV